MGITESQVHKTADQLLAKGKEPTIAAIRELIGSGSLTTISKHFSSWKAGRGRSVTGATPALDSVKQIPSPQLAGVLKREHPQIVAVALSHLDPKKAAEVMHLLPKDLGAEVMDRLSTLSYVRPLMLAIVNGAFAAEFAAMAQYKELNKGGIDTAAGIWKELDPRLREQFSDHIRNQNPELYNVLKQSAREGGK